jgi:hypothetical protein
MRGKSPAKPRSSPEQLAANHQLTLQWREEWRASKAGASQPPVQPVPSVRPKRQPDEAERRTRFAEDIARLEFGRAYWDRHRQTGSGKKAQPRKPK